MDGRAVGGYLYLALGNTVVAYRLWFRGIGRLSATQVTFLFLGPLSPLTAAVVGWAALGQALTPVQLAGMAMAFGATLLGQRGPRTSAPATEASGKPFGPPAPGRRALDTPNPRVEPWQGVCSETRGTPRERFENAQPPTSARS